MRDPRLSIPRVGSSNLSECASGSPPKFIDFIGLLAVDRQVDHHPRAVNARGSKRTLTPATGRKVPEKVPDRFGPYVYFWNRQDRKGQRCWMTARGKMNSCRLEFEDGFKMITSRNAIRKAP